MSARTRGLGALGALALGTLALLAAPATLDAQAFRRDAGVAGFTANTLPRNDDESTGLVDIGFTVHFANQLRTRLHVNNNGNVTFDAPLGEFTPFDLVGNTGIPIIAAYFADVDTRSLESALTQYGQGTVGGRAAFGVNYDGVGYYSGRADKLNVFQLILVDRSDVAPGDFDIEFNYDRIDWETGDASGGAFGFGGTSAAVGYSEGTGLAGSYAQLPGSLVNGALLDGGPRALVSNRLNSTVDGRYVLYVRNGTVLPPIVTPEPATAGLLAAGLLALGAALRRRTR